LARNASGVVIFPGEEARAVSDTILGSPRPSPMSVQIAYPSVVVTQHRCGSGGGIVKTKSKSLSASTSASAAAAAVITAGTRSLNLQQRRRRASILQCPMMLSDTHLIKQGTTSKLPPFGRREGLKLSFNRSISEPVGQHGLNQLGILSPPSVSPSLHPSKRCRIENGMPPPSMPPAAPNLNFLRPPPVSIAGSVSLPNSPCSESSTLQRTILLQNASTVDPTSLAAKLEASHRSRQSPNGSSSQILLVDCRPFIAYNVNHIRGAINVNCCDRFNRKRLQQGKATLADLATTKEGKETLKRRTWKEVVVYDDCSDSLEKLPVSHTLFIVMNALVEDHRAPVMLLGGLRDFQVGRRVLCEDHLMSSAGSLPSGSAIQGSPRVPYSPLSHLLPDLPSPSEMCDAKDIENHPASQVLPYLFLGNMRDASDASALRKHGIKFVLNVTAKPPIYSPEPDIVYKQLEAADNGIQNLRQFFEEAFAFIDRARLAKSGVLIHCHAGVSRSPTIAVAYLMKYYPMAMSEAYKFVKTRRSIISPNLNFMGQLWEFEQGMRSESESEVRGPSNDCSSKEPLTDEMRKVKDSISKAAFEIDSASKAGSANQAAFRWSEATAVHQQPQEDGSSTGCSV
jgi:hypothetical protein